MVLNYIWVAFFLAAFVVALVRLALGDLGAFPAIVDATFQSARTAFEISLGLAGTLALWMGVMKIGERSGVVRLIARWLTPLFVRLFPELPRGSAAYGHIFMNLSANMLGLDNAATPLGLRAMEEMQRLNPHKERATNAMIMFLVLNTSGLTLVPVTVLVYRAQMGAAQPTDVFIPILLATSVATLSGIVITSLMQRISLFNRAILGLCLGLCALVSLVAWASTVVEREVFDAVSQTAAAVFLFGVIVAFIVAGLRKRVNVYEAFVEGAKGGFHTAVGIIPYLVAMLVGIGVLRASGAMDYLFGLFPGDIAGALPTALMKPLSGSGARGLMIDAMQTYGPDSFVGRLACLFQGATDTTFYILAVYFGAVGIRHTRHAVVAGLLTDLCGVGASIWIAYLFFA